MWSKLADDAMKTDTVWINWIEGPLSLLYNSESITSRNLWMCILIFFHFLQCSVSSYFVYSHHLHHLTLVKIVPFTYLALISTLVP